MYCTVPTCRAIETPRAPVKKIRFAPGKGNSKLLVLYTSRLDIRDFMTVSLVLCSYNLMRIVEVSLSNMLWFTACIH